MDKTGTIITTNNGARLLFGYPSGTMVGLRVEKLMPAQYSADHQAYVDKYVETRVSHGAIGSWKGWSLVVCLIFFCFCVFPFPFVFSFWFFYFFLAQFVLLFEVMASSLTFVLLFLSQTPLTIRFFRH
jgi:hypothetical protein